MRSIIICISVLLGGVSSFAQKGVLFNADTFSSINNSSYTIAADDLHANEVRPFITDDVRVVGRRLAQMEAWFRIDKESGQQ
jgi:hypothetical protein